MKDIAYFRLLTIQSADKYTVYRNIESESSFTFLANDSSRFMGNICSILYKNPMSVSLISDCASASEIIFDRMNMVNPHCLVKSYELFRHIFKLVWGEDVHVIKPEYGYRALLSKTYIINHNKKVYFDLDQYVYHSNTAIHPLAALTIVGYTTSIERYRSDKFRQTIIPIGSWAFDVISVDIEPPKGYKKIKHNFVISNEFMQRLLYT